MLGRNGLCPVAGKTLTDVKTAKTQKGKNIGSSNNWDENGRKSENMLKDHGKTMEKS